MTCNLPPLDPATRPVLTIPEAGAYLGLSRSTAYELARLGRLPVVRFSERRLRVPTAALLALLDGGAL